MTIWKSDLPKVRSSPCPPLPLRVMPTVRHSSPDESAYRKKFSGKYEYRLIKGGVGHNLPQEAPQAFAQAIVDVDGY